MIDFKNIEYLKTGNNKQKMAFKILGEIEIFDKLKKYNPILAGTIPIDIDLPESDLDIICECSNHEEFRNEITRLFSNYSNFKINKIIQNGIESSIANFYYSDFEIEIFAQNIPTHKQNAYKHMLIEHSLLLENGPKFKNEIIKLKSQGFKTEAAFAKILNIKGNPYLELLKLKI